jgi:Flp pilus assembly protein TadG
MMRLAFFLIVRKSLSPRRRQTGAALVEYAFIFIVFMSVIFGISGFSHAVFVYHHINTAAKEGARYATVRGYNCNRDEAVASCQSTNSASGISGPTTLADVTAYVQGITPPSIDTSKMVVTACGVSGEVACTESSPAVCSAAVGTQPATSNYDGCTVKVTVSYPYNFMFPLIPTQTTVSAPCTSAGFCMSSTAEMVIVH